MSLGEVLLGLAGIYLGANAVATGAKRVHSGLNGPRTTITRAPQRTLPPLMQQGRHMGTISGQIRTTTRQVRTLDDRMAQIIALAEQGKLDPTVIAWTRKELSRPASRPRNMNGGQWAVPEKDTRAEIAAIFNAMRRDVRYTSDIVGADTYQHPRVTLKLKTGDCDDYSSLGCAALMSAGIPCRFKVIRTKSSPTWDHIYIQGGFPKHDPTQWMSLDASVPVKPGWEAPASMVAEARIFEIR
jgi:predicted transglutaminase-like cysteine proteinase